MEEENLRWNEFLDKYYIRACRWVNHKIYSNLKSFIDSEDIIEEALLDLHKYKMELSYPLLLTIANQRLANHIRKANRKKRKGVVEWIEGIDKEYYNSNTKLLVGEIMSKIEDPNDKLIIYMLMYGCTLSDMSNKIGWHQSKVKHRIFKLRKELREII